MDLSEFLFGRGTVLSGIPLFRSQADLAREILKLGSGGTRASKVSSTNQKFVNERAFINQVLKRRRSLSAKLRKSIESATQSRLSMVKDAMPPNENLESVLAKLEQAFTEFEHPVTPHQPLDDVHEFGELEAAGRKAKVHFILTFQPAETTESSKAEMLKNELIERLALAGDPARVGQTGVCYNFFLSDRRVAIRLWQKLYEALAKQGITDVDARLSAVNKQGLKVFTVRPVVCVHPTVVYDPESPNRVGFVLYYHQQNRVSVGRMSVESLHEWHREIYLPLIGEPTTFEVEPLPWEKAKQTIQSFSNQDSRS